MSINIFIMIIISSNFLFNFTNFCVMSSFLPKFLTLGILFSTAVTAVLLFKLVILGISPLTSIFLAFKEALVAKFVISGILSSIFLILVMYTSFFKWYGKTWVTSYELRVVRYEQIQKHELKFKSTSYEFESTSYEFESTSSRIIKS